MYWGFGMDETSLMKKIDVLRVVIAVLAMALIVVLWWNR